MIILAALVLFLLFKISTRLTASIRTHFGSRKHAPSKRPTPAGHGVTEAGQQLSVWTALDDIQLIRLLKDSAPR